MGAEHIQRRVAADADMHRAFDVLERWGHGDGWVWEWKNADLYQVLGLGMEKLDTGFVFQFEKLRVVLTRDGQQEEWPEVYLVLGIDNTGGRHAAVQLGKQSPVVLRDLGGVEEALYAKVMNGSLQCDFATGELVITGGVRELRVDPKERTFRMGEVMG